MARGRRHHYTQVATACAAALDAATDLLLGKPARPAYDRWPSLPVAAGSSSGDRRSACGSRPIPAGASSAPHPCPALRPGAPFAGAASSIDTPAPRNTHAALRHGARPLSAPRALRFFYQYLLEYLDIQRLVRHQPLQALVFLLQLFQPPRLRHLQAAVFAPPLVKRHIRDAVLAAQIDDLHPGFGFLQYPDDLLLTEPLLLHDFEGAGFSNRREQ